MGVQHPWNLNPFALIDRLEANEVDHRLEVGRLDRLVTGLRWITGLRNDQIHHETGSIMVNQQGLSGRMSKTGPCDPLWACSRHALLSTG